MQRKESLNFEMEGRENLAPKKKSSFMKEYRRKKGWRCLPRKMTPLANGDWRCLSSSPAISSLL